MPRKKIVAAPRRTFPIVGVGASAGGLEAFRSLLQKLPTTTGMAFVFVQHLDPEHESLLPKLLSHATRMPVAEVKDGLAVEPNRVYVIPPNTSMGISNGILHLVARRRQDGIKHMPVDHFLQSLAENEGNRAIGVILSGVANDGTLGLTAIKAAGGITFAQDGKSAKYDGMPHSAVAAGCVDFVLPPEGIARELRRIGLHPYLGMPERPPAGDRDEAVRRIIVLLRNASGIDFTHYKRSTINRRIARRMVLLKCSSLRQYLKHLHDHRAEVTALYEDILIHVTGFFREPDTFRALKETVLPRIFRNKPPREPLRIWVAGCSTGEEVYSVAITVLEYLADQSKDHASRVPVQIFATDVSDTALEKARAGIYSEGAMAGVSRERTRMYFVRSDGGYQIIKPVREMCIFARQDLSKDPPYSRLDLLTCRNVLIYMEPVLQKKVMTIFHYALKPAGFLVLGKSESISGFSELFTPVGRKRKIYSKKPSNTRPGFDMQTASLKHLPPEVEQPHTPARFDVQKEADRIVMSHYAPAGLVADDDLQILHFRGNVAPYLAPAPGQASLSLLRMVRPEFAVELRTAIHRARKQDSPVRKEGVVIRRNGHLNEVSLEVIPLKGTAGERFLLVLFQETRVPDSETQGTVVSKGKTSHRSDLDRARLQRELQTTKGHLQSIIEEHGATNEELKSANEEVLSSNEELQSTNEELETAQEELQSANEELVTVNEQLQNRNQELSLLSDDWSNLLSGLDIPVVMLGKDRRIRRFTPQAEKLLGLLPSDIGRTFNNVRPSLKVPDVDGLFTEVVDKMSQKELEIKDRDGRWYSMRLRPYRTADHRIDGVLMIFIDIHVLKTMQEALREQSGFSAAVMESSGALVMVTDVDGRVVAFNRACQIVSGHRLEEIAGEVIWDSSLVPKDEIEDERAVYRRLMRGRGPIQHESHWAAKGGGRRLISWNSAAMPHAAGQARHLVRMGTDITERRQIETALKASEVALRQSEGHLQALTTGLLTAQEEERAHVARELHDDISQKLAALNLEADKALQAEPRNETNLRHEMTQLCRRLRGILRDVEQTAYRLHPSSLDHLGLSVALKSYCADFGRQNGIAMSCIERNLPRGLPARLGLTIYRVVQEALRNVLKHSGSRRAMVSVAGKDGAIILTVKDSGRGFDASQPKKRGLGLISMEERVRQAGGTFTVKATPGTGVRIEARLPIPRKPGGKAVES